MWIFILNVSCTKTYTITINDLSRCFFLKRIKLIMCMFQKKMDESTTICLLLKLY